MQTQPQTLAFTTAALLKSSLPFMLLSLLCTLVAALALVSAAPLLSELLWNRILVSKLVLLVVLVLALPLAWLSLRIIFDTQILHQWAHTGTEQALPDFTHHLASFDQSLVTLGTRNCVAPRDLATRARGCLRLQKQLVVLVAVQWLLVTLALALRVL